jgi:hypothetical protein
MTGEEALNKYYDAFANTVANTTAQGRADLGIDPEISKQYNQLNTRVQNIQDQYSLAGRLGGYEQLALDPPWCLWTSALSEKQLTGLLLRSLLSMEC